MLLISSWSSPEDVIVMTEHVVNKIFDFESDLGNLFRMNKYEICTMHNLHTFDSWCDHENIWQQPELWSHQVNMHWNDVITCKTAFTLHSRHSQSLDWTCGNYNCGGTPCRPCPHFFRPRVHLDARKGWVRIQSVPSLTPECPKEHLRLILESNFQIKIAKNLTSETYKTCSKR